MAHDAIRALPPSQPLSSDKPQSGTGRDRAAPTRPVDKFHTLLGLVERAAGLLAHNAAGHTLSGMDALRLAAVTITLEQIGRPEVKTGA